jgi:hypothetical protein
MLRILKQLPLDIRNLLYAASTAQLHRASHTSFCLCFDTSFCLAVYPKCWQRMRQLMAATPMGEDFAAYRDPFVTYGDWLFWQLPELATADDGAAAVDSSSNLQEQQQQAEHMELLEMFGEAQMKADVMADAFRAGGLDLDAVFEQLALCDGEAADLLLL